MLNTVSPAVEFVLTDAERDQLVRWSRGSSTRMAARAKIILGCAEPDVVYAKLADELGVTRMTVINVRRRFAASRLVGLVDRPRPGRAKAQLVLSEAEREQLARWSRRGGGRPSVGVGGGGVGVGEKPQVQAAGRARAGAAGEPGCRQGADPPRPPPRRDQPVRRVQHR